MKRPIVHVSLDFFPLTVSYIPQPCNGLNRMKDFNPAKTNKNEHKLVCPSHMNGRIGKSLPPGGKEAYPDFGRNLFFFISFFSPLRAASFYQFCWRVSLILHQLCAIQFTHCKRITYLGYAAAGKKAYHVRVIWNTLEMLFFLPPGGRFDGTQ